MNSNSLNLLFDQLHLTGMKEHLPTILSDVDVTTSDILVTKLCKLLEIEVQYKKSRSVSYRLKKARFPTVKLLSDTKQAALLNKVDITQIINSHENIMFIGGSGSAKTHLAIGLAFIALEKDFRVKFYTFSDLASELLNAHNHNYEIQYIRSLQRFHLLVVDELGYVPIKPVARPLLFDLFSKLYEKTSIIITTHLQFEEWGDMFGTAKATKAIIDRLTHYCHIIETGNSSFRVSEVKPLV